MSARPASPPPRRVSNRLARTDAAPGPWEHLWPHLDARLSFSPHPGLVPRTQGPQSPLRQDQLPGAPGGAPGRKTRSPGPKLAGTEMAKPGGRRAPPYAAGAGDTATPLRLPLKALLHYPYFSTWKVKP